MKKIIFIILVVLVSNCNYSFAQYPFYLPLNGLIGWYPFTGNANDSSGNGNNATVYGPTLTTDRFGNANCAYHFKGYGDDIITNTNYFNAGWNNYTISCWLNSDTLVNPYNALYSQILINTIPFNGFSIDFNWGTSGKYSVWAGYDPTVNSWNILSGDTSHGAAVAHTWNHVVLVKNNDTAYDFYLNGVYDKSFPLSSLVVDTFCYLIFGRCDSMYTNEAFFGKLDDYGIWKGAITPCEVTQLYTNTTTVTPVITKSGTTLSTSSAYTSYQWTLNGTVISGATNDTHTITTTGNYAVYVTDTNGCSGGSLFGDYPTNVPVINSLAADIKIYPNPSNSDLFIQSPVKINVQLMNLGGQLLLKKDDVKELDLRSLPNGIYLLSIYDGQGNKIKTERISVLNN